MAYQIDLSALSVLDYKELLKNQNLLPGRRMLWENIDHHFEAIARLGIENIAQLLKRLSTPEMLASFAMETGISEAYLIILKREIGSMMQKPVLIADFPGADEETVSRLNGIGIKNSKEYFESGFFDGGELSCLCDLVRINGVGPAAAKAFYEAGYRSVKEVADAGAEDMLKRVSAINTEKGYYKAKLGVRDMQFCIDFAALLAKYGG